MSEKYTAKDISQFLRAANSDLGLKKYKAKDMIPDYCKAVLIGFQLQAELAKANEIETDLNNSIGFLKEGIAQWKAENKRLRDTIQAARQWQSCPECNKLFATQS